MKPALLLFALSASVASASLHNSHHSSHHAAHAKKGLAVTEAGADVELTERDYEPFVNLDDRDTEGWEDIESVGLMMERDVTPAEMTSLEKRASERRTRDLGFSDVELQLDSRGDISFPKGWEDVKDTVQKITKRVGSNFKAAITWYTGGDLLLPACCDASGFTPTDASLIAAVTEKWSAKPECGQYLKLKAKGGSKSVVVRVVDLCGGCAPGKPHVDLTKAAFKKLYSLDVGFMDGIQVKKVSAPFGKYTKSLTKLFGPESL